MKKSYSIVAVLVVLLVITGFLVVSSLSHKKAAPTVKEELPKEESIIPPVDASVRVGLEKSKTKNHTILITVAGLSGTMNSVAYELTYASEGLIKGVNSGSKPIDVAGKDEFEREVYLGTCSRNVCKPDLGVGKVSVVLEFTDASNKKSQFSKDYEFSSSR